MAKDTANKTFTGGMNKDADFSLVKENQYYDAQNFKLIADKTANSFILENAEGNSIWLDASVDVSGLDDTFFLVGHCYIQPYLVLFYTTNDQVSTPTAGTSVIVRAVLDKDELQSAEVIYTDGSFGDYLLFSTRYPIKAVGYYEAEDNIKVYWTDSYNPVRSINIMDTNLSVYTPDMLELIPDFPISTSGDGPRAVFSELIQGSISSSSIQYTYQYYIPNGPTTAWAPASAMIQIPKVFARYSDRSKGGEQDESTGYGVAMTIDIPSNSFSRIKIAAIEYSTYNGIPNIRVFSDRRIPTSTAHTLTVNDTGETLSEIVYDDFLVQNNIVLRARDLAVKDNYLFAANVRETVFDVDIDCRAYRFNSSYSAILYQNDLVSYYTINPSGNWSSSGPNASGTGSYWEIPSDADCINLYNKSVYNSATVSDEASNLYLYQSDGLTIGATGSNVEITVITSDDETDYDALDKLDIAGVSQDQQWYTTSNLWYPGQRSFQRNEVYRIGLVFRNEKMQASPVKWVCDFKMPAYHDETGNYALTETSAATTWRKRLGLQVDYTGSTSGFSTVEIVMVPRDSEDRSILAQGLVQPTYNDSSEYHGIHHLVAEHESYSAQLGRFLSPEVSFNKNLEFEEEDFLHYIGYYTWAAGNRTDNADGNTGSTLYTANKVFTHTSNAVSGLSSGYKKEIEDGKVVGYVTDEQYTTTINATTYRPYISEIIATNAGEGGACTTHFAFYPNNATFGGWWTGTAGPPIKIALANYKRDVFLSQYGGIDYNARQNSQYISISDPNPDTTSPSIKTYEGDTFIEWFFYNNACTYLDGAETDTSSSTFLFPVETSISLGYRLDDGLMRNLGNTNSLLVQEISGSWESNAVDGTTRSWDQDLALYQYNSVYSQLNNSAYYLADYDDFESFSAYPTRVRRSEVKINNEQIDSFTTFLSNNFIDLDGKCGPINNLYVFNNNLYFWQNSGFGVASVNTRSLISDNQPGVLALGTGGVLDRFDYISETIGNQNMFGIVKSRAGLYWIDNNKNEIFKFTNKLEPISKLGGIQTWINSQGRIGDAHLIFDHKYNDVLFTITFARVATVETVSNGIIDKFTPNDTTGLYTGSNLQNVIVNGSFDPDAIYPQRTKVTHVVGPGADDWYLMSSMYGEVGKEFYITFEYDTAKKYTLVYNEIADTFVSFNSFIPYRYVGLDTNYLSTNDYHDLYKHNDTSASKSTYYGTEYDSELTLIFNKNYPYSKVWDSIKWVSQSLDSDGVNQFKDTWYRLQVYNDYQNTGPRSLYYQHDTPPGGTYGDVPMSRRERTWSCQIPRNIVNDDVSNNPDITDSANWDASQSYKERIRDKYIICNFKYDNSTGNTFSVPFISANYRYSIR